jgi:7-cyano-7-deazaguanine reductase
MEDSPLGRKTSYPDTYSPELLHAISRAGSRAALGIDKDLPFGGTDIWNAWELTWLADNGQPRVAECELRIPAASPNIVESKSLKLYLNAFSMSPFPTLDGLAATIQTDLGECTGSDVKVAIRPTGTLPEPAVSRLPGTSIDDESVGCDRWEVEPGLLRADPGVIVEESLHTHLLRSLCPVTAQPDTGSLLVSYRGPRIDPASLLRYVVSFRRHQDFHEACIERMFTDIMAGCGCAELTVYARYQRRGGIDINPYRTTGTGRAPNLRLWRQ